MARFHATGAVDPSKIGPYIDEEMKILADLKRRRRRRTCLPPKPGTWRLPHRQRQRPRGRPAAAGSSSLRGARAYDLGLHCGQRPVGPVRTSPTRRAPAAAEPHPVGDRRSRTCGPPALPHWRPDPAAGPALTARQSCPAPAGAVTSLLVRDKRSQSLYRTSSGACPLPCVRPGVERAQPRTRPCSPSSSRYHHQDDNRYAADNRVGQAAVDTSPG